MTVAGILFVSLAFAAQAPTPATTRPSNQPACEQVSADALADLYDSSRLDNLNRMETTLGELIALTPDDLSPVYRLAKAQENHGLIDAAEETLLQARRRKPDEIEPNRQLAQFYSRLVSATALRKQEARTTTAQGGIQPGEPDENGVYRIGGSVTPPRRVDAPYPQEALAAGVQGVVTMEVTVDPLGNVSNAKVVRSIPQLDAAALQAAFNWHFAPSMVNGQAVPVKMNVTVNFVPPQTSQQVR